MERDPDGEDYLHMDDEWQWRFFVLRRGRLIAKSAKSYFSRAEALQALKLMRQ